MWAIMIYLQWSGSGGGAAFEWSATLLLKTFLQAIAGFFLWYAAVLVFVLAGAKHNGLIGDTEYSIEDDGFRYVTESTNSITRWQSIGKARIFAGMIVVELSGYIFCLLPRHQFESDHEFESFYHEIEERLAAAENCVE